MVPLDTLSSLRACFKILSFFLSALFSPEDFDEAEGSCGEVTGVCSYVVVDVFVDIIFLSSFNITIKF